MFRMHICSEGASQILILSGCAGSNEKIFVENREVTLFCIVEFALKVLAKGWLVVHYSILQYVDYPSKNPFHMEC